MPQRVQLKADVYMHLDGQPRIVLSGSVIDVPDNVVLAPAHATTVAETAASVTKSTSVRSIRTR